MTMQQAKGVVCEGKELVGQISRLRAGGKVGWEWSRKEPYREARIGEPQRYAMGRKERTVRSRERFKKRVWPNGAIRNGVLDEHP